jgi:hypothetical protein
MAFALWQVTTRHAFAQGAGTDTRAIFDLIQNWGAQYFPLQTWRAEISQSSQATEGIWLSEAVVISYKRWHGFANLPLQQVTAFADADWLEVTFSGYQQIVIERQCVADRKLHIAASATFEDKGYALRYWLWSDSTSLAQIFAAYPAEDTDFVRILDKALGSGRACPNVPLF